MTTLTTDACDVASYLRALAEQRRLAPRTVTLYQLALGRLTTFMAKDDLALSQVKSHHIRGWVARLHAQGLQGRSIAIQLAAWRGWFNWLGQRGRVAHNPADGIRAPKQGKPLPKALSVDQAVALADAAAARACESVPASSSRAAHEAPWLAARDHCMVELLYGCGLRSAELLGLDVHAHPAAAGWIDIPSGQAHVLGKGGKRRIVPVGPPAIAALSHWLSVRSTHAQPDDMALMVGRGGKRLGAPQLRKRLQTMAQQSGLPTHVHPHMLRHSFASHLLQSSSDLRGVQELLGHAHISSTQIYTRLDFQHLAKAYDAAHPRALGIKKPPTSQDG
jgi:integrase/recombinase XerC